MLTEFKKSVIEGFEKKPCFICKKLTNFIEICSEAPFCCQECLDKFYDDYNEYFNAQINDEDIEL